MAIATNEKSINYGNLSTFAAQMKEKYAEKTAIPTKTSDLTNDSGYQTSTDVTSAINSRLSSTYKAAGSVAFSALPAADADHLGMVYNITNAFTTTDAFVEGSGKKHSAGTNVAIVVTSAADAETTTYGYDALSGFVDLSGYVEAETGKGLSTNDYTTAEQTKLSNIAEGATKVESSTTNGNIKINGTEVTVYTLPTNVVTTDNMEFATEAEIQALFNNTTVET